MCLWSHKCAALETVLCSITWKLLLSTVAQVQSLNETVTQNTKLGHGVYVYSPGKAKFQCCIYPRDGICIPYQKCIPCLQFSKC